jgi:hypothetical protein
VNSNEKESFAANTAAHRKLLSWKTIIGIVRLSWDSLCFGFEVELEQSKSVLSNAGLL